MSWKAGSSADTLRWELPDIKAYLDLSLDGKDCTPVGPTVPKGLTLSATKTGPRSLTVLEKLDGKLLSKNTYRVSSDGKTLTAVETPRRQSSGNRHLRKAVDVAHASAGWRPRVTAMPWPSLTYGPLSRGIVGRRIRLALDSCGPRSWSPAPSCGIQSRFPIWSCRSPSRYRALVLS